MRAKPMAKSAAEKPSEEMASVKADAQRKIDALQAKLDAMQSATTAKRPAAIRINSVMGALQSGRI